MKKILISGGLGYIGSLLAIIKSINYLNNKKSDIFNLGSKNRLSVLQLVNFCKNKYENTERVSIIKNIVTPVNKSCLPFIFRILMQNPIPIN